MPASTIAPKPTPQDRKAKRGHYRLNGKDFPIRINLEDDWTFTELVAESERDATTAVRLARYILLDDDGAYEALKAEATVEGFVSADRVGNVIREIIEHSVDPNS